MGDASNSDPFGLLSVMLTILTGVIDGVEISSRWSLDGGVLGLAAVP